TPVFVTSTTTNTTTGTYSLGLNPGNYIICEAPQSGWSQTSPINSNCSGISGVAAGGHKVTVTSGSSTTGKDFGNATSSADLGITKTDGSATYTPGAGLTYTIVATNHGPSNVTDATVSDSFDAALGTPSWTAVGTAGTSGFDALGTGNISDSGITIPSGGTVTYTVNATVSSSKTGNLVNTATVSSSVTDPGVFPNSATDTDTQASSANLAVSKTDGVATYTPRGSTTYTITFSNAGSS